MSSTTAPCATSVAENLARFAQELAVIDQATAVALSGAVFDVNGDGTVDGSDPAVIGDTANRTARAVNYRHFIDQLNDCMSENLQIIIGRIVSSTPGDFGEVCPQAVQGLVDLTLGYAQRGAAVVTDYTSVVDGTQLAILGNSTADPDTAEATFRGTLYQEYRDYAHMLVNGLIKESSQLLGTPEAENLDECTA